MVTRTGASRLGCLVFLLILVAVGYFGFNVGEVYFRYYRFRDAMEQEVHFADTREDSAIVRRLAALADSLGLPDEAGRIGIQRRNNRVTISARYSETVELPLFVRELHFEPQVTRSF